MCPKMFFYTFVLSVIINCDVWLFYFYLGSELPPGPGGPLSVANYIRVVSRVGDMMSSLG